MPNVTTLKKAPVRGLLILQKLVAVKDWSFSALQSYKKCPRLYMLKKSKQITEPSSPAMDRGNVIHKEGEDYLNGAAKKFPASFVKFKPQMVLAKKKKAVGEQSWAFRKDWSLTVWNDWAACWLRMKIDLHYVEELEDGRLTLYIVDYKTGKDHSQDPSNDEQLELYVLAGAVMYPEVKVVVTSLWYLDAGTVRNIRVELSPAYVEAKKKHWEKQIKPLFADKVFQPRCGDHCRWCPDRKDIGGGCIY